MTVFQYADSCAPFFRKWAERYSKEHSSCPSEYNFILHFLIFKYQLAILKKLEPEVTQ